MIVLKSLLHQHINAVGENTDGYVLFGIELVTVDSYCAVVRACGAVVRLPPTAVVVQFELSVLYACFDGLCAVDELLVAYRNGGHCGQSA